MATLAGLVIALIAVWLVLEPLLRAASGRALAPSEPLFSDSDDEDDPLLARRDRALAALKEIDFDKATGKLSDEDYERMKVRFTAEALEALRATDAAEASAPVSPLPSSAVDALIAAARQSAPSGGFCIECGTPLEPQGRFCLECGSPVSAPV